MLETSPSEGWTEIVWPATLRRVEGRYGLFGSFSARDLLRKARSMRPARAILGEVHQGPVGC